MKMEIGGGDSCDAKNLMSLMESDKENFRHDVTRMNKDCFEKMIDLLSLYKINTLHMHLTDAAGWRIEIDKCHDFLLPMVQELQFVLHYLSLL